MSPEKNTYKNFNVALYCQAEDILNMADKKWLEQSFNLLRQHINFNKVYLETFRMIMPEKALLQKVKDYFESKGIKTAGGWMSPKGAEGDMMTSFCFTNPKDRQKFREIVTITAELFDEFILDDLFTTNCKCELCTKAKGNQRWTEFRLEQMKEVSENLIIKTARKINPKIKMIIKYPNWYDDYQFLGYNLEAQPKMFDMIYTGTETRDPVYTTQHLQQYQGYGIMRYFENVKPGKNGGGWVDPGSLSLDRWAEEINLTLFAKPREVTFWPYGGQLETIKQKEHSTMIVNGFAVVAGYTFEKADLFLDKLGQPYGVPAYKPYHSSGEGYLHAYLGMLGIPIDIVPDFPAESRTVLLTECAKFDDRIVEKIHNHIVNGKTVVITSGLLKALQGKGIEDLIEVDYTDEKVLVNKFLPRWPLDSQMSNVYHSDIDILIPQIKYGCTDMEEIIQCLDRDGGYQGYSLLMQARGFGDGKLYVLTIPDDFGDLYHLPQEVLTHIKYALMQDCPVSLKSPARVCLFTYDNNTFITESFLPNTVKCKAVITKNHAKLHDLMTGEEIKGISSGDKTTFEITCLPRSYRVFKFE